MTKEEISIWSFADSYVKKFGYSVVELKPSCDKKLYTLKFNQLGSNASPRQVTVFADQFQKTAEIIKNIDDALSDIKPSVTG